MTLVVKKSGPGITFQDLGRSGYLAYGLTGGGAADRRAVFENATLLDQLPDNAVLEMTSVGGSFEAKVSMRIALTGGELRAFINGIRVAWNASHRLAPGDRLDLGPAIEGSYAYLGVGGGFSTPPVLGSRSTHIAAGLGRAIQAGDTLIVGPDTGGQVGYALPRENRFSGGTVRVVPSFQTQLFTPTERARFEATVFERDVRANRQGVRFHSDVPGFSSAQQLSVVSDVIVPGDIQIAGDGMPFVLLAECQTTGGYPRLGTVLSSDLPKVAQASPGSKIQFTFVDFEEAVAIEKRVRAFVKDLHKSKYPLVRDPHDITDLLSYRLIDGVISALSEP